jgi:hypothetical protein
VSYARLDDRFWMHPAVLTAGNTAAGIFARFLSYSGCYLTDGHVPAGVAATIVGKDTRALDALVSEGLVVRLHGDHDGALMVPDFLDYNRSKADMEAYVESRRNGGRAKAGRNGRA